MTRVEELAARIAIPGFDADICREALEEAINEMPEILEVLRGLL